MTDTYSPSLTTRVFGGLQWAATALVCMATVDAVYTTYLLRTQPEGIDAYADEVIRPIILGSLGLAFVGGCLWDTRHMKSVTQETRRLGQRFDYLFMLWIGCPLVVFGLISLLQFMIGDLLTGWPIYILVYGYGSVPFTAFIVYYLRIELIARFLK